MLQYLQTISFLLAYYPQLINNGLYYLKILKIVLQELAYEWFMMLKCQFILFAFGK